MMESRKIVIGFIVISSLLNSACTVVAVAGAAVSVTSAAVSVTATAVKTTAKAAGAVVDAVIPESDDESIERSTK